MFDILRLTVKYTDCTDITLTCSVLKTASDLANLSAVATVCPIISGTNNLRNEGIVLYLGVEKSALSYRMNYDFLRNTTDICKA